MSNSHESARNTYWQIANDVEGHPFSLDFAHKPAQVLTTTFMEIIRSLEMNAQYRVNLNLGRQYQITTPEENAEDQRTITYAEMLIKLDVPDCILDIVEEQYENNKQFARSIDDKLKSIYGVEVLKKVELDLDSLETEYDSYNRVLIVTAKALYTDSGLDVGPAIKLLAVTIRNDELPREWSIDDSPTLTIGWIDDQHDQFQVLRSPCKDMLEVEDTIFHFCQGKRTELGDRDIQYLHDPETLQVMANEALLLQALAYPFA